MKRLLSILFWSVIAAAFIGPGTITTCASAGARYGPALLWAIAFSTFGCFVLQEAAARVAVVTGQPLARVLGRGSPRSSVRWLSQLLILGAIVVGCAAYQAGNIIGAVAGASLGSKLPAAALTLIVSTAAMALLGLGTTSAVARVMGVVVAVMGVAFLITAAGLLPPAGAMIEGLAVPTIPPGAGLLVIGLVGTTIVPYNLFLGSGLVERQPLGEVRTGLAVAIFAGGAISMAVLLVGGAIEGAFSFEELAQTLAGRLGGWARSLFAVGLFCAGFSSAVTSPLAAAVTARGLFERTGDDRWGTRRWRFRAVWLLVLLTGLAFGLAGLRPVPVILLAQALNGLLLPVVAAYLLLVVNDRRLMGPRVNPPWANLALAVTLAITVVLGVSNLLRAGAVAAGFAAPGEGALLAASAVVSGALGVPLFLGARRRRALA